jgi:Tol biopolymer transport system component
VEPLEDRHLLAAILFVNDDATGLNTGASWADAYTDLQAALAAATAGDEIWVAAGTYKPTAGTDRSISFNLKEGVSLYGGFAGTESARSQRDWTANVTTLSGDIGKSNSSYDNSRLVVAVSNVTIATLDGFTISDGTADDFNDAVPYRTGACAAGLRSSSSSPTLCNLIISNNDARAGYGNVYGGGMLVSGGSPTLSNVTFSGNAARGDLNNRSAYGGGMYVSSGSPTLTNVTFSHNCAAGYWDGYAAGGGLYLAGGSAELANVVFRGNYLGGYCTALSGGGMYVSYAAATLTNVTFVDNVGIIAKIGNRNDALAGGGSVTVTNGIFWGDSSNDGSQVSGSVNITYSIVQGGWTGEGNLDADPLFVDAGNGDFRLKANSPAVDSGTATGAPAFDRDGNPRAVDGSGDGNVGFDMGAYEAATLINQPPVAETGGPYTVFAGSTVTLSAAASYDPDTAIRAYEWDLDYDGATFDVDTTGVRPDFSAESLHAGDQRTVALRVIDTSNAPSAIDTTTVTVVAYEAISGGFSLVSGVSDSTLLGSTGNGNSGEYHGDMSDDGRYVAFESSATNLVPGDTNGCDDIFVVDMVTSTIARVSTDGAGNQANGASSRAVLSTSGRYLQFESCATNLAPGCNSNVGGVFVKDLLLGTILCISTTTEGNAADDDSFPSAITDDGRYAAFGSYASNLSGSGNNGQLQLYFRDVTSGVTTCLSTDNAGNLADSYSYGVQISEDGRYVSFASYGTNLVPGDTNSRADVFLKDMVAGTTTRVSTDAAGNQADGSSGGQISDDGRYLLIVSSASNLVSDDTNGVDDAFLKDLSTGAITRLSTDSAGNQADGGTTWCEMTSDHRYVLLESDASNLIADDSNGSTDLFVKDLITGTTTRVIEDIQPSGTWFYGYPLGPTPDCIVFSTAATGLVADDLNGDYDVFVREVPTGATRLLSARDTTITDPIAAGMSSTTTFSMSADGRYTVFSSTASNLVVGDTNGKSDVFVQDLLAGTTTRISTDGEGNQGNGVSTNAMMSAEGPYVLFTSSASNLVADDTNGIADVFVKDLNTDTVTRVSTDAPTSVGGFTSFDALAISADGRYVAYTSEAVKASYYSSTTTCWLCLKDLSSGVITRLFQWHPDDYSNSEATVQASFSDEGRYVAYSYKTSSGSCSYVRDMVAGTTLNLTGLADVAINADGSCLAFTSTASSLVDDDTNGVVDVFVAIFGLGIQRVSTDSEGVQANGDSYHPTISADGRYVVFTSSATNLVGGDTNGCDDVFVKDLVSGITRCVSVDMTGNPAGLSYYYYNAGEYYPAISADGRYITFQSFAGDLTPGDGNSDPGYYDSAVDVFRALNPFLDEAPSDITLSQSTVDNHAARGTAVGTFSTVDLDASDTFTYTLVSGEGDSDNAAFVIVGDQLKVFGSVNFFTQSSYSIRVRSTDALGRQSYEKVFTIGVVPSNTSLGLYDPLTSIFYVRCENASGVADVAFAFGEAGAGWQPVVGDWDGDGVSGVGLYDAGTSTFYLTNSFTSGYAQYTFGFGEPGAGWMALAGDWDGDGRTGVGLYDSRTSTFYLTDALQTGTAQCSFAFGDPHGGWMPVVGDWNGDRRSDVGFYDWVHGTFYLTSERQAGYAEKVFGFGEPGGRWRPVAGDWNGDGQIGVGLYDPQSSTYYLADRLAAGYADCTFGFGQPGAGWVALAGCWGAASTGQTAQAVDEIDLAGLAAATLTDLDAGLGG